MRPWRTSIRLAPDDVLVVVDEAYAEFATSPTSVRCFPGGKPRQRHGDPAFPCVFSLAGLGVGYAVTGQPETINELRRSGLPFTVNTLAEVAAVEALKHQDWVRERGT